MDRHDHSSRTTRRERWFRIVGIGGSFAIDFVISYVFNLLLGFFFAVYLVKGIAAFESPGMLLVLLFLAANTVISALLAAGGVVRRLFWAVDKTLDLLFGMGRCDTTARERLECSISQVKYSMMRKDYREALGKANEVLRQDRDHPEALFLKANILWRGFGNPGGAKACLERVVALDSECDDSLRGWSETLLDRLENEGGE